MSYVEVFAVDKDGDVLSFAEARNNHGYAPIVWDALGSKYGYCVDRFGYGRNSGIDRMWKEWPSPRMTPAERLLLGSTFDFVWIKREHLPALADALDAFYEEHAKPKNIAATTRECARILREIFADESNIGAAFNQCSAVRAFWHTANDAPEDDDDPEERPWNVLRDVEQKSGEWAGRSPWEIGERLTPLPADPPDRDPALAVPQRP